MLAWGTCYPRAMKLATTPALHDPAYPAYVERCRAKTEARYATVRAAGAAARAAGKGPGACPYSDTRKPDGRLTWSRHWRNLWFEGYGRP